MYTILITNHTPYWIRQPDIPAYRKRHNSLKEAVEEARRVIEPILSQGYDKVRAFVVDEDLLEVVQRIPKP